MLFVTDVWYFIYVDQTSSEEKTLVLAMVEIRSHSLLQTVGQTTTQKAQR